MKKLVSMTVAAAALLVSANVYAEAGKTVRTVKQSYTCQQGKNVKVTYGFNKQGLPTFAESFVDGKTRGMKVNLAQSGAAGTVFGDENSYSLASVGELNRKAVRSARITITAPDGELVFKDCGVRGKKRRG
ncbi:MAG: adhesin [Neisseria sp.]|nr:adhesin [Neisseria sp.]